MNYKKKIPLFAIVALSFIMPPAFAAELVLDDFSDGAAMVNDGGNCTFSDDPATVLGGTRGIFACKDSGAGSVTSETETTLQQFIFTLNQADGSSGLNYDDGGNLLGGVDVTDGGANNALRLDFIKADQMTAVTVTAADTDGKVGTFVFQFGPSGVASEFIPFAMIKDPVTMEVPDFSKLDYVGILLEGQELTIQDTELILGKIATDFSGIPPEECPPGQVGTPPDDCSPLVGGSLIPIDMTMVLLAGTQMTAAWMIPVIIAGIGFAIVIARKF